MPVTRPGWPSSAPRPRPRSDIYDAIIVGAGHHGLTCATYLARAGKRVVVLEREPWLGGMTYSRETVAEAPGFVMNPCAVDLLFTNIKPSIIDELRLESFGLRQVSPEPWGAYLGPDGQSIGLWRSLDRTVEEILVRDGTATGVRLVNGEVLSARQVIGALDPVTLMQKLVDSAHVPEAVADEVAADRTDRERAQDRDVAEAAGWVAEVSR